MKDNGKHLRKMINNSENIENVWEIPKGRRNGNEKSIDTAVREFKEETNILMSDYNILWNASPIIDSHEDDGVKYVNEYYMATPLDDKINKLDKIKVMFSNVEQISEIEQIKWVKLQELNFLALNTKTLNRNKVMFKNIKNMFLSHKKL
jgi:8-oxo-dGTP pyrophosphatase MutT (NUDIX family)